MSNFVRGPGESIKTRPEVIMIAPAKMFALKMLSRLNPFCVIKPYITTTKLVARINNSEITRVFKNGFNYSGFTK